MTSDQPAEELSLVGTVQEIPEEVALKMTGRSWKSDCPVPMSDLRYLSIPYWGFDDAFHTGHMIVHRVLAQRVVKAFAKMAKAHFPIECMKIIDEFDANDDRSMEANNSSAFCSRGNTNRPGIFSVHSYGGAIDVNPKYNPWVKKRDDGSFSVSPESSRTYIDRTQECKHFITDSPDNVCFAAFTEAGFKWGGHWVSLKDYQHFEIILPEPLGFTEKDKDTPAYILAAFKMLEEQDTKEIAKKAQ